ncbi:uncharacterized protein HD556DRAFT_1444674 [Suillus plorans]|uniref:CCHC-type domain-containing protein n=1 Tax=Suillus plorans TaxID=116603 RepID=A0A9P7DFK0_9AGAM|nr:uncharacterized protein HD556DRAFT_1444674 [Suillus plorans]KAG1792157.1 hypothetical protein HD556DRAFT_1444674 [Suillus plorans]
MTNPLDDNSVQITLKDSDYGRILRTIENSAFNETAILTPAYSQVIDNILGEKDARLAAGTSLAVCIIRTTKLLEDVANRVDLDEETKKLAIIHLQKRIRGLALHLLPLDFPDIANQAVKIVETRKAKEEEIRPVRPPRKRKATIDRTRITLCKRCGGYGHNFRKCPDAVCCICSEIGPDHLSVHCPRLGEVACLPEFRDDEEYYELLVDWEKNHVALEELIVNNPAPRSPTPISTCSITANPDEETRERVLS